MKVFVSWSGQRSQAMAIALRDWLPLVLHYADPWLSTADIKSGDRWSTEVAKGLQDSNFGIICITRDNLEAPWLLFESGALAKSMEDGRVIPLRLDLDVSDISGPLAQFQSERADEDGIKNIVTSLNKVSSTKVADERLARLFELSWPDLQGKIESIPASGSAPKKSRPQAEILDELVASVRSVEMRVRDIHDDAPSPRRNYRRRIHPGMLMELSHQIGSGPGDPIQLLVFASMFRDDFPWLYELALDAYRASRDGNVPASREAMSRFNEAVRMMRRGPMLEMAGADSKAMHMMLMEFMEYMPLFDDGPKTQKSRSEKSAAGNSTTKE